MGKKISREQAIKMGLSRKNDSIFCYNNPYGYKLSINHPEVRPFYEFYKRKIGAKILSDAQRLQFESMFLQMRNKKMRGNNENNI